MITNTNKPEGLHEKYTQTNRHWCPISEKYTGADSLLTAQRNGWQMLGIAYCQRVYFSGGRYTKIYHIKLIRGSDSCIMRITHNPFITRMFQQYKVAILQYAVESADKPAQEAAV